MLYITTLSWDEDSLHKFALCQTLWGKKKQKQEYPAMWMPKGIHEARSVISEYWTNNTLIVKQLLLSLAFIKNGTSLFK